MTDTNRLCAFIQSEVDDRLLTRGATGHSGENKVKQTKKPPKQTPSPSKKQNDKQHSALKTLVVYSLKCIFL